jgi:hypothetical protein
VDNVEKYFKKTRTMGDNSGAGTTDPSRALEFSGVRVVQVFQLHVMFLCYMLGCPLRFPHKNDIRVVFTPMCCVSFFDLRNLIIPLVS